MQTHAHTCTQIQRSIFLEKKGKNIKNCVSPASYGFGRCCLRLLLLHNCCWQHLLFVSEDASNVPDMQDVSSSAECHKNCDKHHSNVNAHTHIYTYVHIYKYDVHTFRIHCHLNCVKKRLFFAHSPLLYAQKMLQSCQNLITLLFAGGFHKRYYDKHAMYSILLPFNCID